VLAAAPCRRQTGDTLTSSFSVSGTSALFLAETVVKAERKLIGIEALGPMAEPRALQLLDDGSETFDLGIAMREPASNIANQALVKCWIAGEMVEIEQHVRCYSSTLIRRSNVVFVGAVFCELSGKKWAPEALRCWHS
jgi:hypothetical protein